MVRYFWKETGRFPGMTDDDPVNLDYNLWEDVLSLDEFIEFERAYQLENGVFVADE